MISNFNQSSKILHISHKDMDGCGCTIITGNIFQNIEFIYEKFGAIDKLLPTIDASRYDYVLLTDLYPDDLTKLDLPGIKDKLIFIDHHGTSLPALDVANNRFVHTGFCASKLTKSYFENMLGVGLNHLNSLVDVIDDYDLWQLKDPRSISLNVLFGMYMCDGFRNRFFKGNIEFTPAENSYISEKQEEFSSVINRLTVMELENIEGAFIVGEPNMMLNETCHYFLNCMNFRIVYLYNTISGSISVRHNIDGLDMGKVLTAMGIGGGHEKSAGFQVFNPGNISTVTENVNEEILKLFPDLRRK